MGWFRDNALVVWLGLLLVSGTLLAVVLGYAGLVVYSALGSGTGVVGVLAGLAVPYLPVVALLLVVAVVSGLASAGSCCVDCRSREANGSGRRPSASNANIQRSTGSASPTSWPRRSRRPRTSSTT